MVPSILFSWVMLSIIVGVAAVTRGHNAAWFLFALIISPLLAALCLIALRHRRSRSRPSNVVVVFCGRSAQRVVGQVLLPSHVRTLKRRAPSPIVGSDAVPIFMPNLRKQLGSSRASR
jgi:hypothetical protein